MSTIQHDTHDPFLQRAVEYWLDAANELGYQPLFCSLLCTLGFTVKHFSKSGPHEQGKDVIAVDAEGIAHAFQLKGGDITLRKWRDEVKPEIEELIEIPIKHPGIDKSHPHISYLVTNGELDDTVRVAIDDLNASRWKDTPVIVWRRGDLLTKFQAMAHGILPRDAQTYKELIDLIFPNPVGLADIESANSFFSKILRVDEEVSKEQRRRDIAAAVLYANLMVGTYRKNENHISVLRILVLLLTHILLLADKRRLADAYWLEAFQITWADILQTARALEAEINTGGFTKAFDSPLDRDLMPMRKHAATAHVLALKLSELIDGDKNWTAVIDKFQDGTYNETINLWGEASLIPFVFLTLLFRQAPTQNENAYRFSIEAMDQILKVGGRKAKEPPGLISPYYDFDFAIKRAYKLLDYEFEDDYRRASYFLKPLIELLARRGLRVPISDRWREISFFHFEQFIPSENWRYYLWRSEEGDNATYIPEQAQSWKKLVIQANSFDGEVLPNLLKRFPSFVPFFLVVFTHRLDSETLALLDRSSS
ncbi:MAG TPA: hypothetical protein VEB18_02735 [Candidatus Paceibacterota bacterium]|nr:hypothetical protein [Candidatus Paceibacterota bacterium]